MVFSFFKKPPPEKMVARPAAVPPRPQTKEPQPVSPAAGAPAPVPAAPAVPAVPDSAPEPVKDMAPLDFTSSSTSNITTPSEFSDLSETPGEIHLENDIDPVEAEIEQAAVLYANAQDEATRAMLEHAVLVHQFGPGERLWLMLFDLYRLGGHRAAFDALSLEYARAFEKSPPAWLNTNGARQTAKSAAGAAVPAGTVLFKGELTGGNDAAFAALDQALEKNPKLRIELAKVREVDDLGAERLLGVLEAAHRKQREIELVGRDALVTLLEGCLETGRKENPGCWLLLLDLYQLMGKQEVFEDMAINYAVTFEMSPPSWDPKRVAAAASKPTGKATNGGAAVATDAAADDADESAPVFAPKGDLKAERFPGLQAFAEQHETVHLDFSTVTRVDFVSAGTLVNLLAPAKRAGKRVIIRHPNHLVAELLIVVGLKSVAEIVLARA